MRATTHQHKRPMSVYEVHLGSWRVGLDYRELAAELTEYVRDAGFTHVEFLPGGRASLRRLLGLPGHVLLRPDLALRQARRPALPHRRAAPGGHRRHRRLGAGALPEGRVGAGALRRHAAVRARRPAPRRAARLGHLRLRLRPHRGAQLPRGQRPVLARGVPRRRPARRRRRVDALPGLLAQGRRVVPQPVRRPREPRGRRLPAGAERDGLQARPRRHHDRRGVDRVAGCHAAHVPRRARLRLQVEHGLDARHASSTSRTSRSTGSTTTTR